MHTLKLKELYGMPKFQTKTEKDIYNIKFLTQNMNQSNN